MSLRSIHIVFIAASIGLTAMAAWWGASMWESGRGGVGYVALAAGCAGAGLLLIRYLDGFVRRTRRMGMK